MTPQEALQGLKASIEGCGFQCHIGTYRMAIEALEKQIPAKVIDGGKLDAPIKIGNTKFGANTHILRLCPKCANWILPSLNKRYCNGCGQALDWEDLD